MSESNKKEEDINAAVQTVTLPISPSTQNQVTFCANLRQYGVPLDDRCVHSNLLHDLLSLNKKHKKGHQKLMLSCEGTTRGKYNLVAIPMADGLHKIKSAATRQKWVHNIF